MIKSLYTLSGIVALAEICGNKHRALDVFIGSAASNKLRLNFYL